MKRLARAAHLLILLLAVLAVPAWAAVITSTSSGNYSDGATWVGGVAPVAGDTIIAAPGHVVLIDVDADLGSSTSAVGHAITIQGTSSSVYGEVRVADGVTLTLRGYNTSNQLMYVQRYGKFRPLPGSTIVGNVPSSYAAYIDNRGIIEAIGTEAKPIQFTSPVANVSWNNAGSLEISALASTLHYDFEANVGSIWATNIWIANAAGTGPGSFGDSSLSFTSTLTTEVASLAEVTSAGKYYVDYDLGVIWFFGMYNALSTTMNYKYLSFTRGWGISSVQTTTYNEAKFDWCSFQYMGPNDTSSNRVIKSTNKRASSVEANRLFYLKNSVFTNCYNLLGIDSTNGSSADLVNITGNTFNAFNGYASVGQGLGLYRASATYINLSENTIRSRVLFLTTFPYTNKIVCTGWKINDNVGYCGGWISGTHDAAVFPDTEVLRNTIYGLGSDNSHTFISSFGGTAGHPVIIADNLFYRPMRTMGATSHCRFTRNRIAFSWHHGIIQGTQTDLFVSDVQSYNNIFYIDSTGYGSSPNIEFGYVYRIAIDDSRIFNNTFIGNKSGGVGFGDMQDSGAHVLGTRLAVYNNLCITAATGTSYALNRRADSSVSQARFHVTTFDYNMDYGYDYRYRNLTNQGSFSGISAVTGIALFDPSFSSKEDGTLAYVHTSNADRTLQWGDGDAVQLVLDTGTATSGGNTSAYGGASYPNGYLADSSKAWTTDKTSASCPSLCWVSITGGTGVGQARAITNNTATQLTITPAWDTVPDATSTYAIIRAEVLLTDGAETVHAGIYVPELNTASASDAGTVTFADHSITGADPLLLNPWGSTLEDFSPTAGSPVLGAGLGGTDIGALDYLAPDEDGEALVQPWATKPFNLAPVTTKPFDLRK